MKGKKISLQWRNPANTYLNQVIKANIINNRIYQHHGLPVWYIEKLIVSLLWSHMYNMNIIII